MIKRTIAKLIIVISIITISLVIYIFVKDYFQCEENNQDIDNLIEDVFIEEPKTEETKIDWDNLKSINKDIIGWIEIEGTSINYPILKDDNSLYYLKHNYLKKYNSNGSIFTLDKKPFNDSETLIYGHNMKNGAMFSLLGNYLNKDFLFSHQKIKIYTPDANYEGTVFSCYSIGIEKETNNISNLSFEEKIEYYKNASQIKIDNVAITERIVKLTTCSYINSRTRPTDRRYYIVTTLNKIN